MKKVILAIIGMAALSAPSDAGLFDFESLATGNIGGFALTDGGVTGTFSASSATAHQVQDLGTNAPAGWLSRTLLPELFNANHTFVTFNVGLTLVAFQFGDFGSDDDFMHLRAFDSSNVLVGSADVFYATSQTIPGNVGNIAVTTSGGPIMSIELWEDGQGGTNDIYIDNMRFDAVPEPATMAALALGVGALIRRRKKA